MRCCMASCGRTLRHRRGSCDARRRPPRRTRTGRSSDASASGRSRGPDGELADTRRPDRDNLGGAPDVTTVRASNDDAGNLEFSSSSRTVPTSATTTSSRCTSTPIRAPRTGCNLGERVRRGLGARRAWSDQRRWRTVFRSRRIVPVCQLEPPGTTPQGSYTGTFDSTTSTLTSAPPQDGHRRPSELSLPSARNSRSDRSRDIRHGRRPRALDLRDTRGPAQYRLATGLPHV